MRATPAKPLFGRAAALASLMALLPFLLPVAALAASPASPATPTLPAPPLSSASPAVRSSAAPPPVAGGAAVLSSAAIGAARALVATAFDQLETAAKAWRQTAPAAWQPVLEDDAAALGDSLGALDAALAAANPGYLAILGDADRGLVALQLAWRRAQGAAAPGSARRSEPVVRALDSLAEAMSQLVGTYGAAARRAARGPMSVGESSSFIRLNQAAASLQARLPALAAAARGQGDAALAATLASLQETLQQIAAAPPTLAGYLVALQASSDAVALWNGSAPFLSAAEQAASQQAESAAGDLTTAAETGFVFTTDFASGATSSFVAAAPADNAPGGGPAGGGAGMGPADDDDLDGGWGASAADPMSRGAFPAAAAPVDAAEAADAAAGGGSVGIRPGAALADAIPADPAASTGGFASLGGAAAAPALPPGANPPAGSADPGRIVIHGGAAGIAEAAAAGIDISGDGAPAFSFELGDLSGEAMAAALAASPEDEAPSTFDPDADAGIDEPPGPLAWEPLCRPWQPPPGGHDLCLAPSAARH